MENVVEICLVYKEDEDYKVERVYAEKFGEYYKMVAIPAFALNIAYGDIISAEKEGEDFFFLDLIKSSGHSVIHIVVFEELLVKEISRKLIDFGVNINYLNNDLYLVIDIPPSVNYKELKIYLEVLLKNGDIDFREACISFQHRISNN